MHVCLYISDLDKLIWHTIGPKSTAQFSIWANGAVNYDYIVTNSINFFCYLTQNGAYT